MPLFKKKDKVDEIKLDENGKPIEIDDDLDEGAGSKIVMVLVTFLVILIWRSG